jgi:isopenicillin N synthase-like dioxygenase
VENAALPIIDVAGLRSPYPQDRKAVARQLRIAGRDRGCFYIRNHGLPSDVVEHAFTQSQSFFELPQRAKNAVRRDPARVMAGYDPAGRQPRTEDLPPTLRETFCFRADPPQSILEVADGQAFPTANQWPDDMPEFRAGMREYAGWMAELAGLLMRGLALSLSLEEYYFAGFCRDPLAVTLLLHYPPQPVRESPALEVPDQGGAGGHTDFAAITILAQNGVGDLQIWDEHRGWRRAMPIPDTFVVTLGDLMTRWTNGVLPAPRHRMINSSGQDCYVIPFFFSGNPDFPIRCIPTCLATGAQPLYPETTPRRHLAERRRAASDI